MPSIQLGDDRFNVLDRGDGPALLLVHGFPLNHTMWNAQIAAFAATHRVIAPDLRGFGKSVVTTGACTMRRHADDLAAILDELDVENVAFCGLSMGGYIAWQFVRNHSDRLTGLVLCDTRAGADTEVGRAGRRKLAERALTEGPNCVAEAFLKKLVGPQTATNEPSVIEAIRRMILDTSPEGIAAALLGMAERPDMTGSLGEIAVPSLVIVGQHDEISPAEEMRDIAKAIPACRFVEIPDSGHMAPMENAPAVNAALRGFLSGV